jgi:4-hydroxy-4-methyl-2-oxoglutarate aldolase
VKSDAPSVGEPVELAGVSVSPGDQIVADCDAVLVIPRDIWPGVEVRAREIQAREAGIRVALADGQHLSELIELPQEGPS